MEEALSCPCVDDLKSGPCGKSFVAAFSCFIRSTADEKARRCAVLLCCCICLLARLQLTRRAARRAPTAWRRSVQCSSAC